MNGKNGCLVSSLPGRLRVRHHALRGTELHQGLLSAFRAWPGVIAAEGNLKTGSILLHYDVARVAQVDMEARVLEAALGFAAGPEPAAPEAPPQHPRSVSASRRALIRRLNRYSKIGMLGSLALSLAALTASKRVHAGAGGVFVALMLVHMGVHRHHLLK